MYHHDVAYDALQAKASTERGKMFTRRFGMNITCRFSLKSYGETCCKILCEYWVQKMSYYFGLWEAAGCLEDYEFQRADVHAFEEPKAFAAVAEDATSQLAARIGELRDLVPSRRVVT